MSVAPICTPRRFDTSLMNPSSSSSHLARSTRAMSHLVTVIVSPSCSRGQSAERSELREPLGDSNQGLAWDTACPRAVATDAIALGEQHAGAQSRGVLLFYIWNDTAAVDRRQIERRHVIAWCRIRAHEPHVFDHPRQRQVVEAVAAPVNQFGGAVRSLEPPQR